MAAVELKEPPTTATPYLNEIKELSELRERCRLHLNTDPEHALEFKHDRDAVLARWCANRDNWNIDNGGMTLAEHWFVTECDYFVATHPVHESQISVPYSALELYEQLENATKNPYDINTVELFENVAVMIAFDLSDDLEEAGERAANDIEDLVRATKQADIQRSIIEETADPVALARAKAEKAVYQLVPMASRFFWHWWAEQRVIRGADEYKNDPELVKRVSDWMDRQFRTVTLQQFRLELTEIAHRDRVPLGGHSFHQRSELAVSELLPSVQIVGMEQGDRVINLLADALKPKMADLGTDSKNPIRQVAQIHMFCYTYTNRMTTSTRKPTFDDFLTWKSDIPAYFARLTAETTKLNRPLRPIIIQTHSDTWYVHVVACDCHAKTVLHIPSSSVPPLRHRVWKCGTAAEAIACWSECMKSQFDMTTIDGLKVEKVIGDFRSQ